MEPSSEFRPLTRLLDPIRAELLVAWLRSHGIEVQAPGLDTKRMLGPFPGAIIEVVLLVRESDREVALELLGAFDLEHGDADDGSTESSDGSVLKRRAQPARGERVLKKVTAGIMFLGAAVLVYLGVSGLYTFATNRSPTRVKCTELGSAQSMPAWLHVVDCVPSIDFFLGEQSSRAWIPLRSQPDGPIIALLETRNAGIVAELRSGYRDWLPSEPVPPNMAEEASKFAKRRDFYGLVTRLEPDLRKDLVWRVPGVPADVIAIEENARPTLKLPIIETVLGLVLCAFAVRRYRS